MRSTKLPMVGRLNYLTKSIYAVDFKASKKNAQILISIVRFVFMIGVSFVMLYPVLFMLSSGFKSINDIYNPTVIWIPEEFTLEPLRIAAEVLDYWNAVGKTLMMTVPSVLLQLASAVLAGYGFARFKFSGRNILFAILIFSIIVPVQSYIIPLYVNFTRFDFFGIGTVIGWITGTPLTVNLVNRHGLFYLMAALGAGIRSSLYIFMIRQFFKNMPYELEEAAMIDGCGPLRTFLKIMLPNTTSMIATVTVFSVVWYWNDYYQSSIFYKTSFPISVNLTTLRSLLTTSKMATGVHAHELMFLREPILACGCLITVLPLVLLYLFAQRYFTEGLERSGIVG